MKKIASMLCAFVLVLSLAACGGGVGRPTMSLEEYKAVCVQVDYDTLALLSGILISAPVRRS